MLRIVCVFSQDTGVRDVQISGKIAPLLLFAHTKSGILRRLSALRITLQLDADYPRHTSPLRPTKSVRRRGLFLSVIFRFGNSQTLGRVNADAATIRSRHNDAHTPPMSSNAMLGVETRARARKRALRDANAANTGEAFPVLPDHLVLSHIFRPEYFDDPADLARQLEELKVLHENGEPWDADTCWAATMGGHFEILQWARAKDCPWNE